MGDGQVEDFEDQPECVIYYQSDKIPVISNRPQMQGNAKQPSESVQMEETENVKQ
jgi:hypothetical protein